MLKSLAKLASAAALAAVALSVPAQASDRGDLLRDANRPSTTCAATRPSAPPAPCCRAPRPYTSCPSWSKAASSSAPKAATACLLHRTGHGWSTPRFYGMGSASFGLQAGLEQAELVFIINSKRALRGIEKGEVKLGAGAGLTVVTLSSGAEGATTTHGGDIVVWTSGTGAYAGLTFNGTVIKQDKDENATPATGPEAQALRQNLASIW